MVSHRFPVNSYDRFFINFFPKSYNSCTRSVLSTNPWVFLQRKQKIKNKRNPVSLYSTAESVIALIFTTETVSENRITTLPHTRVTTLDVRCAESSSRLLLLLFFFSLSYPTRQLSAFRRRFPLRRAVRVYSLCYGRTSGARFSGIIGGGKTS